MTENEEGKTEDGKNLVGSRDLVIKCFVSLLERLNRSSVFMRDWISSLGLTSLCLCKTPLNLDQRHRKGQGRPLRYCMFFTSRLCRNYNTSHFISLSYRDKLVNYVCYLNYSTIIILQYISLEPMLLGVLKVPIASGNITMNHDLLCLRPSSLPF